MKNWYNEVISQLKKGANIVKKQTKKSIKYLNILGGDIAGSRRFDYDREYCFYDGGF